MKISLYYIRHLEPTTRIENSVFRACFRFPSERSPPVTTVSVPGHGSLQGVAVETALGSERRTVLRFLGIPYARPPVGSLRFQEAQPADWTGSWDATEPR